MIRVFGLEPLFEPTALVSDICLELIAVGTRYQLRPDLGHHTLGPGSRGRCLNRWGSEVKRTRGTTYSDINEVQAEALGRSVVNIQLEHWPQRRTDPLAPSLHLERSLPAQCDKLASLQPALEIGEQGPTRLANCFTLSQLPVLALVFISTPDNIDHRSVRAWRGGIDRLLQCLLERGFPPSHYRLTQRQLLVAFVHSRRTLDARSFALLSLSDRNRKSSLRSIQ
jgi:hypothetical protein